MRILTVGISNGRASDICKLLDTEKVNYSVYNDERITGIKEYTITVEANDEKYYALRDKLTIEGLL